MIWFDLTDLHAEAEARVAERGIINGSTIKSGKRFKKKDQDSREVGALGELMTMRFFTQHGIVYQDSGLINHDIRADLGTVEVKTKSRNVKPRPHYDCTVPEYVAPHQNPQWYAFCSLLNSHQGRGVWKFKEGWLLGFMEAKEFWDTAVRLDTDYVDPDNEYTPHKAQWNVKVSDLITPQEFMKAPSILFELLSV